MRWSGRVQPGEDVLPPGLVREQAQRVPRTGRLRQDGAAAQGRPTGVVMTLVLDERSTAPSDAAPRRRRRLLAPVSALALLGLVLAWVVAAKQVPLQGGAWAGPLDGHQLGDGITTTRYVLSVDEGEQVVLTSIRNGGPLPITVLGVDEERSLSWVSASFRDRGRAQDELGYPSAAAAKAAVTASSVTLEPGAAADVLVRFDPPADLSVADGSFTELDDLLLSVRYLGVGSTQRVALLMEPVTLVAADTLARLEREGRIRPTP